MTLKEHRLEVLGEPLKTVAARAGVHLSLLSMIERGLHVSKLRRNDIAKGYKLSIDDFKRLCSGESVGGPSRENTRKRVRNTQGIQTRNPKGSAGRNSTQREVSSGVDFPG